MGNVRRARELFDAATVADKKHIAAWHGWGVLELKQGNIKKARHLLAKGLKFCGGNEYVYQTLALLEAKANRYEQARYLFSQATRCNPKSCASWLVSQHFLAHRLLGYKVTFHFYSGLSKCFSCSNLSNSYDTGMGSVGDATRKQSCCQATLRGDFLLVNCQKGHACRSGPFHRRLGLCSSIFFLRNLE